MTRITKKIYVFVFLLLLTSVSKAQNAAQIDSLVKVAQTLPDSLKAEAYCNICWKLRNYDPEQALNYGKKGLEYAKDMPERTIHIKALSYVGVCYRNIGDYDEAYNVYNEGLELALKYGIKDQAAYSYINIGNLYLYHREYTKADSILLHALEIAREINDSSILAYANLNLGRVNLELDNISLSKTYLAEALKIREERNEDWDRIATVKKYLGDAWITEKNYDEALRLYTEAIPRDNRLKDNDLLSDLYGKISNVFLIQKRYDSALYYGTRCLETSKLRGIDIRIKNASKYLGDVYAEMGNYREAIKQYEVVMSYADTFLNRSVEYGMSNYEIKLNQVKKNAEIELLKEQERTKTWITWSLSIFLLMVVGVLFWLAKTNRDKKRTNELLRSQNDEIEARNSQISIQRDTLAKQQKEITSSIVYAKRIQFALMPGSNIFKDYFSDGFVFHVPKDVVSGDFWWTFHDDDHFILMCADCTGHGVPGAFMSMLGVSLLNEIVGRDRKRNAADILNSLRELIKKTVNQNMNDGAKVQDGMDGALIVVNKHTNVLQYSGANIQYVCYRGGQEIVFRPTRNPIGLYPAEIPFQQQEMVLQKGDMIYLSSDGYYSQFGGPRNTLMKTSGYKRILRSFQGFDIPHQRQIIEENFFAWKGNNIQTDDVLVIGLQV